MKAVRSLVLSAMCLIGASAVDSAMRLTVVGRTGDGKSTFCNLFMRHFDSTVYNLFPESDDASSQTGLPLSKMAGDIRITDTPGLVDTRGFAQDDQNINTIVAHIKREQINHGFLLILNEQAPRFDKALQDAVKRLMDSFGEGMIAQMGIVFMKAWQKTEIESKLYVANKVVPMIQALNMNLSIPTLPSWQLDGHPESLSRFNDSEAFLSSRHAANARAIGSILQWLQGNPPMSTLQISAAQMELHRQLAAITVALDEERIKRMAFEHQVRVVNATAERLAQAMEATPLQQLRDLASHIMQAVAIICGTVLLMWTGLAKKLVVLTFGDDRRQSMALYVERWSHRLSHRFLRTPLQAQAPPPTDASSVEDKKADKRPEVEAE